MQALGLGPVNHEFDGAELGDDRLGSRLLRIAQALDGDPASGFPRAMRSDAELEGLYRFINNGRFSADDIVAPHLQRTFERAREAGEVLAIHDSSWQNRRRGAKRGSRPSWARAGSSPVSHWSRRSKVCRLDSGTSRRSSAPEARCGNRNGVSRK